jgi:hypothetical protein
MLHAFLLAGVDEHIETIQQVPQLLHGTRADQTIPVASHGRVVKEAHRA